MNADDGATVTVGKLDRQPKHREDPAADHAAEAVAVYDLQRPAPAENEAEVLATETHGKTRNNAYP